MNSSYRTLWISDVHLGTPASRADDLLQFLHTVRAERLYLVGDIVDLERMRSKPYFPDTHKRTLARIAALAASGVDVRYIPGNHDFDFREFAGRMLLEVPVMLEDVHETPDGRRLLVIHGDVLDGRIRRGTALGKFGAAAYRCLMRIDVELNRMRKRLGKDYFPLSAGIKQRIASANQYMERFETVAAAYAKDRGFDGIVCGHIHRPSLKDIGGCLYANDGDWVEHGSALAEHLDGRLALLRFEAGRLAVDTQLKTAATAAA